MKSNAAAQQDEQFDVTTHYGFGENWADYAKHINDVKIEKAEEGLFKLLSPHELQGKTFLDIGCGSGLHSLSALRGGVKNAVCVDIDPNSVKTAAAVLARFWPQQNYQCFVHNILSNEQTDLTGHTFDVVYSWGVLHHTGAMWKAIEKAASHVAPGGKFVIALYKKTPLCEMWKAEKKLYTNVPALRWPLNIAYLGLYCAIKLALGQNPVTFIREHQDERGMRFMTDVKDWLGGYPYESASYGEVKEGVEAMGFILEAAYNRETPKSGILGSGCAEYVFTKL